MPPYTTKVASDTDLANVYAFVQARPAPAPVQTIPLLKSSEASPQTVPAPPR
jgi:hypothetical protein